RSPSDVVPSLESGPRGLAAFREGGCMLTACPMPLQDAADDVRSVARRPAASSLRMDRLLTLGAARPLRALTLRFQSGLEAIPILQYRSVSDHMTEGGSVVTPGTFARQMERLFERGQRVISLCTAVTELAEGKALGKAAVLTFDDGLEDFYTGAW